MYCLLRRGFLDICCSLILTLVILCPVTVSAGFKTFKNSIGMEFLLIPAGSFMMGATRHFENADIDELPRHKVTITKPFYIGKYEVTQEQWVKVMGANPSHFKGRRRPVENVSWHDVQKFIKRLNEIEKTDKYRLPTEAEWEYAARAGEPGSYCFGDMVTDLPLYAWFYHNSNARTHDVGLLKPNQWGLYDMHGNVWEWCQDWYSFDYYSKSPEKDPKGPENGVLKVERGGGWDALPDSCRSAYRHGFFPFKGNSALGFRVVKMP